MTSKKIEEGEGHSPTPLEAMTRLIAVADTHMSLSRSMAELGQMSPEQRSGIEDVEVAISIVQAMLNTALPIARFRAFVQVDVGKPPKGPLRDEFTVCAPTIEGIIGGLLGLATYRADVHVTLWEQRATGADMLSGYQGPSKVDRFKSWVNSLYQHQREPTVQ